MCVLNNSLRLCLDFTGGRVRGSDCEANDIPTPLATFSAVLERCKSAGLGHSSTYHQTDPARLPGGGTGLGPFAAAGAFVGVAAQMHGSRALPVYVGQRCSAMQYIDSSGHRVVERILRVLANTLGRHWHSDLLKLASPRFDFARAYLAVARVRVALVAFAEWHGFAHRLQRVMPQHARLAELGARGLCPKGCGAAPLRLWPKRLTRQSVRGRIGGAAGAHGALER